KMSREVRSAENKIIQAEKIAVLASVVNGYEFPYEKLREAWDELLLSQHHDAWICATTQRGRRNWAWQAGVQSWNAECISNNIMDAALDTFSTGSSTNEVRIKVFNTTGSKQNGLVELEIPTPRGTNSVRVLDHEGREIVSQISASREYVDDKSVNAGTLLFKADVPAMGYQ